MDVFDDLDFLAQGSKEALSDSFADVVRRAFRIALDCQSDKEISRAVNRSKGTVSYVLNNSEKVTSRALSPFIDALEGTRFAREVVLAWAEVRWPATASPARRSDLDDHLDDVLPRMQDSAKSGLDLGALDWSQRRRILIQLRNRFAQRGSYGRLLYITRQIAEQAKANDDTITEAQAHLYLFRVLAKYELASTETARAIEVRVSPLLSSIKSKDPHNERAIELLQSDWPFFEVTATVLTIEEGGDYEPFDTLFKLIRQVTKLSTKRPEAEYRIACEGLLSRIELLRGNWFRAYEASDRALQIHKITDGSRSLATCSYLRALVISRESGFHAACDFIFQTLHSAEQAGQMGSHRFLESVLAKLESDSVFNPHPPRDSVFF